MSAWKNIDKICWVAFAVALILVILLRICMTAGVLPAGRVMGYENRLFDGSSVHTIDIVMDDWDTFIGSCENEEYVSCSVVIDSETYHDVGIRAKGNTSLRNVSAMDSSRYSFKIEFDKYEKGRSYYGLDKLNLNNIIQDNTYMKDYLSYTMMAAAGVSAPLCSYVYITVNGEEWGLYLAVEGVEESFLQRNYGREYGRLYKPDSMDMAGGPKGSDDVKLIYTDDNYDSYSNIFNNAKTDIMDADRDRLIASLKKLKAGEDIPHIVDIEDVIRYFVVHNFVCNFDSYTGTLIHNYYLYEEDGQLSMIPWDYNLAFGGFQASEDAEKMINYPVDDPVSDGSMESRPMLAWIFADEEYTALYHKYFEEWIRDFFDSGYFEELIDRNIELIAPYVEKDPTKFCTYEEFEKGVSVLRQFCLLRAESAKGQLEGMIPSTSQGQKQDASALVAADGLSLSDMGTMDFNLNGMPGEKGFPGGVPGEGGFPDRVPGEGGFPDGMPGEEGFPDRVPGEEGFPDRVPGEEGFPGGVPGREDIPGKALE